MFTPRETWHFDTERIGRRVLVYDRVDSTNSLGAALAQAEDADGLVLVADEQSVGRGVGRGGDSRPHRPASQTQVAQRLAPARQEVLRHPDRTVGHAEWYHRR